MLAQDVCVREAMTWLGTHVVFTLILLGFLYMEEKKYISAFSVEEQGSCLLLLNFILKISNNREKKKKRQKEKVKLTLVVFGTEASALKDCICLS